MGGGYHHAELVPTDYALRMRSPFIGMLIALTVLTVMKCVISDFWGALSMAMVVLCGIFVITGEYSVNASSALLFCFVGVLSGIFDIVSCVLYFQHSKYGLFDSEAPTMAIIAQVTFIASPISMFIISAIAYSMWSDCQENSTVYDPFATEEERLRMNERIDNLNRRGQRTEEQRAVRRETDDAENPGYGAVQRRAGGDGNTAGTAPPQQGAPARPFSGQGQRLGSNNDDGDR